MSDNSFCERDGGYGMKKFSAAILGSALLSAVLPAAINLAQQQTPKLPRPPLEHRFPR